MFLNDSKWAWWRSFECCKKIIPDWKQFQPQSTITLNVKRKKRWTGYKMHFIRKTKKKKITRTYDEKWEP